MQKRFQISVKTKVTENYSISTSQRPENFEFLSMGFLKKIVFMRTILNILSNWKPIWSWDQHIEASKTFEWYCVSLIMARFNLNSFPKRKMDNLYLAYRPKRAATSVPEQTNVHLIFVYLNFYSDLSTFKRDQHLKRQRDMPGSREQNF